jgi:sarcosine oxidase
VFRYPFVKLAAYSSHICSPPWLMNFRREIHEVCLHGPAFDPDTGNRVVTPEKISAGRAYVIDRHPAFENLWIVGRGSGHGFKHGPAVGEYTAARVTGADRPSVEPRFSLASRGTEQNRAVY